MKPYVRWMEVEYRHEKGGIIHIRHELLVGRGKNPRTVVRVFEDGSWCLVNHKGELINGFQQKTPKEAKILAAATAIDQGFI